MLSEWLKLLCEFLPNVKCGQVLRGNGRGVAASWPEPISNEPLLSAKKVKAVQSEEWGFSKLDSDIMQVTHPIKTEGGVVFGVLALNIEMPQSAQATVKGLIAWACDWLRLSGQFNQANDTPPFESILQLLERVSQQGDISSHTALLATTLAEQFDAYQVVLVIKRDEKFYVQASSHNTKVDSRGDFFTQLEGVVNAIEGDSSESNQNEQVAAEQNTYQQWLQKLQPPLSLDLVTIKNRGATYGVIAMYHSETQPLRSGEVAHLNIIARQLAPLYEHLVYQNSSLLWRVKQAMYSQFTRVRVAVFAVVMGVVALTCVIKLPQTITAKVDIEGAIEMAVVAPEDGFILKSHVVAGQPVEESELLVQLDDKDLLLDVQRLQSEVIEYEREFTKELNALNHVQIRIAKSKVAQAKAQMELASKKLKRTQIKAPMSGQIIRGDLSRSIGSPVSQGQILFEVAPHNNFKVVAWVPERSISKVAVGMSGKALLKAAPNAPVFFKITQVSSVYSSEEQAIVYRVEGAIEGPVNQMRPGMTGLAKISGAEQAVIVTAAERMFNWLWIKLWAWF